MTTSTFSASVAPALSQKASPRIGAERISRVQARPRHTLASSLAFLSICIAIPLTTMAYGTVHLWALALFSLEAAGIVCWWAIDGIVLRSVKLNRNALQLIVLGVIALGAIQLLPLRAPANNGGLPLTLSRAISLDPYATRLVLVQIGALFIFFAATLVFTDTARRLRTLVRTITIFGFLLAMFGLTQSFTSEPDVVYWIRKLPQSTAFGPFIDRHHFAAYMEMTIGLPLGLLFSGAIEPYKRPLYAFAPVLMGVALIMTNSRGGVISLAAEILFLAVVAGPALRSEREKRRIKSLPPILFRAILAAGLVIVLILGGLALAGPDAFGRLVGTVNAADPTTGRAHFWSVTLDIISQHPFIGSGLGAFGAAYTQFDSRNGLYRLEQAHNDYLQTLSDGGIVGGLLGLVFLVILFRKAFQRRNTSDKFRRGAATGALAGCFAVLVHSAFDFPLHITANALLFLVLAAIATLDRRVDEGGPRRRRRRRSREGAAEVEIPTTAPPPVSEPA